jgi:6-phosphogluconate dehydrogenase
MAKRLQKGEHHVVVHDLLKEAVDLAVEEGAEGAYSLEELVAKLDPPRVVWVMVPAGKPTEAVLGELADLLEPGDIVIEGGNSNYQDTMRRAETLQGQGLHMVDVGTSGGVWGLAEGYSMMVGGEDEVVRRIQPLIETLAPDAKYGWGHVGTNGAGHFVKMVHNGIEYGLMEAYAEGFEIMEQKEAFDLDLHQVAEIWRFGSVVRSWLLDLIALALEDDQTLGDIRGWVADSGEGRWTVLESIALDVPAPVITLALQMRFVSRQEAPYAPKLLAAMRNQFGGHAMKRIEEERAERGPKEPLDS